MDKICVIGGSGFIGSHLLARLADQYQLLVLSRNPATSSVLPNVKTVAADAYDVAQLSQQLHGASAVINLVGILNEDGSDGRGFQRAHVTLIEGLLAACVTSAGGGQVPRLLQISALNAGQGDSHYLRSKGQAEALIRGQSEVPWTIFQPSVVFGPGDGFLNRFASLLKLSPVLPQPCPKARFQPVYVGDVCAAIAAALSEPASIGQTYQLAGPRVYSMLEIIDYLRELLELKRWVIGLPDGVSRAMAGALNRLPAKLKPFSKDNYLSLQVDSVASENGLAQLGLRPTPMEAIAPKYLARRPAIPGKAQRYQHCRQHARRD